VQAGLDCALDRSGSESAKERRARHSSVVRGKSLSIKATTNPALKLLALANSLANVCC
jgi:hypothetical protein